MMKKNSRGFVPVVIFFVLVNSFFISGRHMLERWGADQEVLIIGNAILFVVTMISFFLSERGIHHQNPNVFVRSVYGSIMIKLFVYMIAAFVYISLHKKDLNKPALFTCMALYLVYTFMEVAMLMKLLRRAKHG